MISDFFINRPIFASVLSIIIVLAGLAAMRALPVEQYPEIVPPQVVVTAIYPGASAQTLAETVASPLEKEINGVDNMLYMTSTSSASGQLSITVTFEIGTDPDQASINVNNRVKAAEVRLPEDVRRYGITVEKQSSNFLQVIALYAPDGQHDAIYISNYALLNVIDELKRVPGVGNAMLFGAQDYSMRIWISPDKLAQYNLTPADIAAVVREQNSQFAAGQFGQEPMSDPTAYTYTVVTQGRLPDAEAFGNIIIRSDATGGALRLKDVARIELGAQDYGFTASYNGKTMVPIGIFLQPGANALAVTKAVRERMQELSENFPPGLVQTVPFDTTKFVEVSIHEVIKTFIEAMFLVVFVTYLFLQNFRATLIPLLAVPVSIIGTLAGLLLMGYSINLLTLFALVLAIGIVVDDAIIVIENVERNMTTHKLSSREAAHAAMKEVTGPVIAIVLVLAAVFLPVAFMGGMTGVMYSQFAVTISVSVFISGVVALTLTPALCAIMLKPSHDKPLAPFRWFNHALEKYTGLYIRGVSFLIRRMLLGLILAGGLLFIAFMLFQRVPSSLVPEEDQGYVIVAYQLPPASSLDRTKAVTDHVSAQMMQHPAVESIVTLSGFDMLANTLKTSAGISFLPLKDWSERPEDENDARNLVYQLMGIGMQSKEAMIFSFNPPPIIGMSLTGGFEGYVQSRSSSDYMQLYAQVMKLVEAAAKRPELAGVQTTFSASTPQYYIDLDRAKARALGVSITDVFATMQSTFGSLYVNDFTLYGRSFRVNIQSEEEFRRTPEDLRKVSVRSASGDLVPLDALVSVERIIGPDLIERFNAFPAIKLMGGPAPGYSSGQALAAMEEIAAEVFDAGYTLDWIGSAYQEELSKGTGTMAFAFGLIMIFLILAALYERWTMPLAVITAVPFALMGAIFAIWLRGLSNDLYFQIGIVTLIGLSAKNAILIVEFAIYSMKEHGLSALEAAVEGARLRLRPILMTSLTFAAACVPLALSSGAGEASRHAIGTGVIGGMITATFVSTFFVPMFFVMIAGRGDKKKHQPEAVEDDDNDFA